MFYKPPDSVKAPSPLNTQPSRTVHRDVDDSLKNLRLRAEACLPMDRGRLLGRLRALANEARTIPAAPSRPESPRPPAPDPIAVFTRLLDQAEARLRQRRALVPKLIFPDELPVSQRRDEIAAAIMKHQVIVLCGETGSGKTTQLPKICLDLGRGIHGMIGHTQPRRIAARSVAQRIAEELSSPLGGVVGYKVRFGDKTSPSTLIKLMTDGILLAETQGDRNLDAYDTIIIDEAHERGLNIDFLLGFLRTLLPRRPDLKVIVTSATIDPDRFSRHFADMGGNVGPAPVIMVSGRTYPVEVLYRPPGEDGLDERDEGFQKQLLMAVDEAASYGDGDMLVFLSGEREIRETAEMLQNHHVRGAPSTIILPLFAKLTAEEQMRVFQPHSGRRIVLATNVAETSLTVPGIRFVIDPGMARLNRYSPKTKVQRLEIEAVSRASADQRKGRCGRIGPGVCVRLYSEEDYTSRPQFTDPEIVRTNLASVILQMKALRLGNVDEFPFLDPPDPRLIKDGYETLHELGAVDDKGELTEVGRDLSKLPIDPRIGRMVIAAVEEGVLPSVLVIAAAMSVQDPRERPLDKQSEADEAHAMFRDERSDFLAHLKLWHFWRDNKRHLSGSKLRKMCKSCFLSYVRLREWDEIHAQLSDLVGGMLADMERRRVAASAQRHNRAVSQSQSQSQAPARGGPPRSGDRAAGPHGQPRSEPPHAPNRNQQSGNGVERIDRRNSPAPRDQRNGHPQSNSRNQSGRTENGPRHERHHATHLENVPKVLADAAQVAKIHRALLTGLLANLGLKTETGDYVGPRGTKFRIFPGSALFRNGPKWLMASEVVRTTAMYARSVAGVEPEWIEELGQHLIKRSYFDPHWHAESGRVVAFERVQMLGLELVARRRIHYGTVDPVASRILFIEHALVAGELDSRREFVSHNATLIARIRGMEARCRRSTLLADTQTRAAWFASRIPDTIVTAAALERWYHANSTRDRRLLFLEPADVIEPGQTPPNEGDYPDFLEGQGLRLVLEYKHAVGHADDGVTVRVPLPTLASLTADRLAWLIPGHLPEKIEAIVRGLSKDYRRILPPAGQVAEAAMKVMRFGEGSLFDQLRQSIARSSGVDVSREALESVTLPDHLRMRIVVVGEDGKELATGRDLAAVRSVLAPMIRATNPGGEVPMGGEAAKKWNRDGIKKWDFGPLPERVELDRFGTRFAAFPGLVDQKSAAGLRLFETAQAAEASTRGGVRRLLIIDLADDVRRLIHAHPTVERVCVQYATMGSPQLLKASLLELIAERAMGQDRPPRTPEAFEARRRLTQMGLSAAAKEAIDLVDRIMQAFYGSQIRLAGKQPAAWEAAVREIREQLMHMFGAGFLVTTPWKWLQQYPRYLAAIDARIAKLSGPGVAKDERAREEFAPLWRAYLDLAKRGKELGLDPAKIDEYRWMLEELRVSLFAQELRTVAPVSVKRLQELWTAVVRG